MRTIVSYVGADCCGTIADSGVINVLSIAHPKNKKFPVTCWTNFFPFASRLGDSLGVSAYWNVLPHASLIAWLYYYL